MGQTLGVYIVRETMFENVRDWTLTPSGLSLKAESGLLAWWMFSSGTLRKGRYTLCHSPGAKGTFGGTRLSPIVLHSLEFEGEKSV